MKKSLLIIIVSIFTASCGKKTEETKPIRKDVTETVFASGILEAKNTYELAAEADGYLTQVSFEEGNLINEGKVLAVVDNRESKFNQRSSSELYNIALSNTNSSAPALQQAKNTIGSYNQKMELDLINLQRYQKLWATNSIAKMDLDNAELQYRTSKANYESALENYKQVQQQAEQEVISKKASKNINDLITGRNTVVAVFGGKVLKVYKKEGDFVKRGEAIALIGEPTSIYAKVNVDEANIAKVKIGQEAAIQLNTQKRKVYKGVVTEISPAFDESTQSFICKIAFINSLDFKIISTQLQSNIVVATSKNALLIPRNYIDFGGNVQIKGKNGKTKVETKFVSNEWVQILKGIDENTVLVTDNLLENKPSEGQLKD